MVNKEKDSLKELMRLIKKLYEKKIISTLSILPSGINDPVDYTCISFKIPRYH